MGRAPGHGDIGIIHGVTHPAPAGLWYIAHQNKLRSLPAVLSIPPGRSSRAMLTAAPNPPSGPQAFDPIETSARPAQMAGAR